MTVMPERDVARSVGRPQVRPDTDLQASYEVCRKIHRRHDPTYYWATRRLPRDVRPAVHALYGFVRAADELVDGPDRPSDRVARSAALDDWERELELGLARGYSSSPVIRALVDAGRRHQLPLVELRPYMQSMRVDCGPVRIETEAELDRYMQGSAGSVGRIMTPLLGAPAEMRESFAQLGMAFQLTNFIRDVREDYALDRVYLPLAARERFGVSEADIARGEATPAFRALLAAEVDRARRLFDASSPALAAVGPRARRGIRLARAVYLAVLDRVDSIDFDVFGRRTTPRPWELGLAAVGALSQRP